MFLRTPSSVTFAVRLLIAPLLVAVARPSEIIWKVDNLERIGGHPVTVVGEPQVIAVNGSRAVQFDGVDDGLFVPDIPIAGANRFTIEVLFVPYEGGLAEQRFVHLQDTSESRALIETRLDGSGSWWLDTYQWTGGTPVDSGLTLVDRNKRHPTGRWYWAALTYNGSKMAHFVNGVKEDEGAGRFRPLLEGWVSLGVRQNMVFWFKGAIGEVRFHTEALPPEKLQRQP